MRVEVSVEVLFWGIFTHAALFTLSSALNCAALHQLETVLLI